MALAFGVINDIETGKGEVGLQLRVIRLFEILEYRNKNEAYRYDCVLHDKTVNIIIQAKLCSLFYTFINYMITKLILQYFSMRG